MTPVEARRALQNAAGWFKSTYSGANGGCVEVTLTIPGTVGLRDSKLGKRSPIVVFDVIQWCSLLVEVSTDRLTNTNGAAIVIASPEQWEVRPADGSTEALRFNGTEWHAFRNGVRAGQFGVQGE
ncbi:DUF397 domain-containing protein [Amycolatopsis thermoflava]|uniref:DUF397 domain-containing protein n=1 Tax=Amycolatopsis thermoflava TaxID=84480 RepID=UPI000420CA0E|nr:DUF397 domain-containing protein [Amycolatopsis thermoflava]